ncbi:hypothetical protein DFH28DRAFT_28253 [Melampsora americana]|nr:hypothetical protein DFH28DRAFT_28253 [Melampsora americana]
MSHLHSNHLEPSSRYPSSPSSTASSDSDQDDPGPLPPRRGDDRNLRINSTEIHPTAPALTTPSAKTGSHPWPFNTISPRSNNQSNQLDSHPHHLSELIESDNEGTVVINQQQAIIPSTSGSVKDWIQAVNGSSSSQKPLSSSLPHEILIQILRSVTSATDLRRALLVCKAWCQCGVELLWHKPTFASTSCLIKMLVSLANKNPTFPYITFIRRLNFSGIADHMTDHILLRLINCTRLERLTLSGCNSISDNSIIKILTNSTDLVALDLSDCKLVTDLAIEAVGQNCKLLQGLNLSGCKAITDHGLRSLKDCKALRRLKLKYCDKLTDSSLITIAVSCPLLLEVDLVGCRQISNASLWMLWKNSSHLRELSLSGCTEISDGGFPSAINPSIGADGESHPILSEEANSNDQNGQAMDFSTNYYSLLGGPSVMHFDHIRFLDLTSLAKLTDSSLDGIIKHMPRIRNLVLAKCVGLTDEALNSICGLGKYLHYLHLGHVSSLTDRAVIKVARSCTRLRYIDLACCNNLTDMSVFELAQCLPRLKRIGLVRVTNITDQSVFTLVDRTSLERIHLSYCDNISVGAIHWLLQRLHRLTHLSLTGVPAFRRTDLQAWCRAPPKDFNAHQRQAFCVYSGKGVNELRYYLAALYNSITNNQNQNRNRFDTSTSPATTPNLADDINAPIGPNLAVFNSMPDPRTMATAMNTARQQANPHRPFRLPPRNRIEFTEFLMDAGTPHDQHARRVYNQALVIATQQMTATQSNLRNGSTQQDSLTLPPIIGSSRGNHNGLRSPIPLFNQHDDDHHHPHLAGDDGREVEEEIRRISRRRSDLEQQVHHSHHHHHESNVSETSMGNNHLGLLSVPDREQSVSPMEISDDERPPP